MGIIQSLVDGLSLTSILMMISIGLVITFGVMKVINVAHGELIMIGAYTTYVVTTILQLPFIIALVASFIVSAIVGLIMEVTIIKRLYGRPLETLLATFGASIALQQISKIIFGPGGKSVSNPMSEVLIVGDVVIPYFRLFIIIFSITIFLITVFIMFKTKFGMQLRSISENRNMSECLGLNTVKIDSLTFAIGSGLAGLAGSVLAPLKSISPTMGGEFLVDSFMVVVLGGVGSLSGTALGSFIIGEGNVLMTIVTTEILAKVLIFVLVIIIIRFKPEGLFKIEGRR